MAVLKMLRHQFFIGMVDMLTNNHRRGLRPSRWVSKAANPSVREAAQRLTMYRQLRTLHDHFDYLQLLGVQSAELRTGHYPLQRAQSLSLCGEA